MTAGLPQRGGSWSNWLPVELPRHLAHHCLRLDCIVLALATACGATASPPATPAAPPVDPAIAPIVHTWIVAEHVLVKGSSLSLEDARGFDGRTVEVGADNVTSPWQAACEGVTHAHQPRPLAEVMSEIGIEGGERLIVERFGLPAEVTEFRVSCTDRPKAPPLTLYVGTERAMTCFSGGCYLLKQF